MIRTSLFLGLEVPYIAQCRTLGLHLVLVLYLMPMLSPPANLVLVLNTEIIWVTYLSNSLYNDYLE